MNILLQCRPFTPSQMHIKVVATCFPAVPLCLPEQMGDGPVQLSWGWTMKIMRRLRRSLALPLLSVLSGSSCLWKRNVATVCMAKPQGLLMLRHSLWHHSWLPCSSRHFIDATPRPTPSHWEPLLLIYISIKQYEYNGFIALLALGHTAERPTADTDRGDW